MPNQAPIVNVADNTVLLNTAVAATTLFSVEDPDGDSILKYRFLDLSSDLLSGYFDLNGAALENGSLTEIDASDLNNMFYVGGTEIADEDIMVQAWDGLAWSNANATGTMYTTRQQITPPEAVASDFTLLANEILDASSFISASDPDGFPILRYYIKDDRIDQSYFKLGDTVLAQGTFHYINAAQMPNLQYHAFGNSTEKFRAFAYDGSTWSAVSVATATTTVNKNRPTMEFDSDIVPTRESVDLSPYLTFYDADGNSIKTVRFWDTSDHEFSGYLMLDGVQLDAKQWIEVAYEDLGRIQYMGADREMDEEIAVRVYDGKFWSPNERITLSTVFKPELGEEKYFFTKQLEVLNAPDLFPQIDAGPASIAYEIVDMTAAVDEGDLSGHLRYFGNKLNVGEVYSFSRSQFNNVNFVAGPFEARVDDEIFARSSNGVFWSDWTRVTVSTHPEFDAALDSGVDWTDYNWTVLPEPYLVTYSFMQQFPGYDSGDATADNWYGTFRNTQRAAARRTFDAIEGYCNLEFQEVSDSSIQEKTGWQGGIIRMGNYTMDSDTAAYAYYPSDQETGGDIWINCLSINDSGDIIGQVQQNDWSNGTGAFAVFMHELGHALGMKHPFEGNPILPPATENFVFTLMSYTDRPDFISPSTHALYDIYQLQQYYGVNENHATGDDVYSIANTWGGQTAAWTLWDAAGNDTLSAEGSAAGAVVDLRAGRLSSIGAATNNIGLAIGIEIENALGSSRGDTIFGNEGANVIDGGAGADVIEGLGGRDRLTGGADNDTFVLGVGDGNDLIFEDRQAGWDTIQIRDFPGFDDFTEDLSFRAEDRDLVMEYTLDNGRSKGSVTINNQKWGAYRVETLEIGSTTVDLVDLYNQCTADLQQFTVTGDSTKYGSLAIPV
ncbi:MAG: M10 family metallopeptidase C-terminal domain-containing protein [Mariniblastus sp.]|nr:M10 family metallopeptidase C-terminal domain-containing protein [Mariniblastus sp.]